MIHRLLTDSGDNGLRLDQLLHEKVPELSRTKIRKVIDMGGVHIAGRRVRKCGLKVSVNQQIELHLDQRPLTPYRISEEDILFQDKYLLALNKPVSVETQPTMARYKGTLYEALQIWLKRDRRFGRKLEIGMVQRLDRDTSGVIVFSIHPRSHKGLSEQIRDRTARKIYLALVQGEPSPPEGVYTSLLARERSGYRVKSVEKGGKEAITHYITRRSYGGASLVEVSLVTGRMHQIRAHFSEDGHPLLGDTRYGGSAVFEGRTYLRQCLHSWKIELNHPISGQPLLLTAQVPADMSIE